ncbi:MAG: DNA repair protein RadC [Clostridiaceae bacterium]|nr:DNA repair protein RadC [Clostridiaceae bacterium]
MSDKGIHKGHRERVRQRYLEEGLDGFKEHEIVELLLFYCIPMKDTNALAHKLLNEFGSLHALLEADPRDIQRKCNVSINTAVLLSLIAPLSRRYLKDRWGNRPRLNNSYKAGNYALSLFSGRVYECFYVISLDSQNNVNHSTLVHEGTINEAPVYPRIIVETALRHKANSIILAHNHPGGSLNASKADIEVTRKICQAMKTIGIDVADHIIVAGNQYMSFVEQGIMDSLKL